MRLTKLNYYFKICVEDEEGMKIPFYFLGYTENRESIALVRKIDLEILMKIQFLRHADFKRIIFGMSSVCLSVGLSVCLWTP